MRRSSEQIPSPGCIQDPIRWHHGGDIDRSHWMALLAHDVTMERTKLYAIAELDMYCLAIGNKIEARLAYSSMQYQYQSQIYVLLPPTEITRLRSRFMHMILVIQLFHRHSGVVNADADGQYSKRTRERKRDMLICRWTVFVSLSY